jgi:hypothetical protein
MREITSRWRIVSGSLANHIAWVTDDTGLKGVVKRARDRSDRKLIEPFNEIVCYQLAGLAGTLTAETHLEWSGGEPYILSVVKSELNFGYVLSGNVALSAANLQSLTTLFVTDWWLANTDRPMGKNEHLAVVKTGDGIALVSIDYSHALNGCLGEVFTIATINDPAKIPIASYNHIAEPYITGFNSLQATATGVQTIADATIDKVVDDSVVKVSEGRPAEEVSVLRTNAAVVRALLKARRNTLGDSLREWCRTKGKVIT